MSAPEIAELLERAAPSPAATLDMDSIQDRARWRRRRRRSGFVGATLFIGLAIALVAVLPRPQGRDTVVAGPPSSRPLPMEVSQGTITIDIHLLDGTRLRVTAPEVVAEALRGATFGDVGLSGSVYADRSTGRGWRIDVTIGSVASLIPGGEPLPVRASRASEARVDRPARRIGLQFGPWAVIASGDALGDPEITTLLDGLGFEETANGFLEYRGTLALWIVDSHDGSIRRGDTAVSVNLRGGGRACGRGAQTTSHGLIVVRVDDPSRSGTVTMFCGPGNGTAIELLTPRPLTADEIDQVDLKVLSVGSTLAALQQGQHP